MSNLNKAAAAAMIPALVLGSSQVAGQNDAAGNTLTIYSTAQPGAISPELYRSGGRGQVDFRIDTSRKTMGEDIEVKLRNQKKEPVTVIVKENLYRWVNWQITSKSHDFDKQDARTVHFPVKIAAGGEVTLRYSVQYTW